MKINDLNSYPLTPVNPPPAGQLFQDPVFNTSILRITDKVGSNFINAYSAIFDTFNVDSSRFVYYDLTGTAYFVELDVKKKSISLPINLPKVGSNTPFYWSRKSPDVFYIIDGWQSAKLWKYDFKTDNFTLVADFTLLIPAIPQLPNTTWCGSRGMTWDDNRFHVNFADNSIGIYDVKLNKIIGLTPFTVAQRNCTNSNLSTYDWGKTTLDVTKGNTVISATGPYLVANLETQQFFSIDYSKTPSPYGDVHPDFGSLGRIASSGGLQNGPVDGFYPLIITLDSSNLSTWSSARKQIGPRFLWGIDTHSSFRDGVWNTISVDLETTEAGKTSIFNKEIFQLSPDSPPDGSLNRRLVQHQSDPTQFTDASLAYYAQSKGCVSQDGRCFAYCSTYGKSSRIDLYIAFLDDTNQMVEMTPDEVLAIKSLAAKL